MEEGLLTVQMFGEFSVMMGNTPIIDRENRGDDSVKLLQYLLLNRNRNISKEELARTLLYDQDEKSSTKTLSGMTLRLQKIFKAAGAGDGECIIYANGVYSLSDKFSYDIDAERFVELTKKAQNDERGDEKTLQVCLKALNIYKGEFLFKTAGELWIVSKAVQYQDLYSACLKKAYRIAGKTKEYGEILPELQKAAELYPYDEDLNIMYISSLYETNQLSAAQDKYEEVTAMMFESFGIEPSGKLLELHEKMVRSGRRKADSIFEIRQNLNQQEDSLGAYYCDFEGFAHIYQFVARHVERSGQSVYLMLCSITDFSGISLKTGERMSKIAAAFKETVKKSFRKGDVYTRYGPTQFLFILMDISREDCDIVARRMQDNFCKIPKTDDLRLACRFISAVDMDRIMQREGFGMKQF